MEAFLFNKIGLRGHNLMKVLIVDDAAFMRMMLKNIMEKHDIKVAAEVANGVEAVESYKKLKPDFVTLDITMPEMDGIEALKEIRSFDPSAKVIICSAIGQQEMVIEAVKDGAKDFIIKPFQEDRVLDSVKRIFPEFETMAESN